MRRMVRPTLAAVLVAALSFAGAPGFVAAQAPNGAEQQIEYYSTQLDELADKDEWGATTEDRRRAREALKKARELVAQGSMKTARWLLKRVDERITLVRMLVKTARRRALAEQRLKKFKKYKQETLPKLEKEVEKLKKEKETLEERLRELE